MNSLFVIELVLATFLLSGLYGLAGYYCHYSYYFFALITRRRRRENNKNKNNNNKGAEKEEKITGLLAMTYISNILVVVLAHQFFDIKTEALAAFYQIPYYGGLLLLKNCLFDWEILLNGTINFIFCVHYYKIIYIMPPKVDLYSQARIRLI
jgi:hypothetical protein